VAPLSRFPGKTRDLLNFDAGTITIRERQRFRPRAMTVRTVPCVLVSDGCSGNGSKRISDFQDVVPS
jgi:hypothetical protein